MATSEKASTRIRMEQKTASKKRLHMIEFPGLIFRDKALDHNIMACAESSISSTHFFNDMRECILGNGLHARTLFDPVFQVIRIIAQPTNMK